MLLSGLVLGKPFYIQRLFSVVLGFVDRFNQGRRLNLLSTRRSGCIIRAIAIRRGFGPITGGLVTVFEDRSATEFVLNLNKPNVKLIWR